MILNNEDTRKKLLESAGEVYEVVKTTLGPKGRNVILKDKFGSFTVTHDGVTVARAYKPEDEQAVGADLIKTVSHKLDSVGDGTTSVTILTYHLLKACADLDLNPMVIRNQLLPTIDYFVAEIEKRSKKATPEDLFNVAKVSSGDPEIGKTISDLMQEVGVEGAITVQTTKGLNTETEVSEGFSFDRGYVSPYFVTDPNAREVVLEKPAIIVVNGTIRQLVDFKALIDPMLDQGIREFLIIADNVENDALSNLIMNKVKGVFQCAVVKSPGAGDDRLEQLQDIAVYSGATLVDADTGNDLKNMNVEWTGRAKKVVVRENQTVIIGGIGSVKERLGELRQQNKKNPSEALEYRIAQLNGKVATIKIGGASDTIAQEKKYRIDDAVAAVRAAMKGGIVAGGGVTLRDIAYNLDVKNLTLDEKLLEVVKSALLKPQEILFENSGLDKIPAEFAEGEGLDVMTGETVKMVEAGIVDPTPVTVEVVRQAIETAALALTVGGAVIDKPVTQEELNQVMRA